MTTVKIHGFYDPTEFEIKLELRAQKELTAQASIEGYT